MPRKRTKTTRNVKLTVAAARANYKLHLAENPNYFGSISKLDIAKPPKLIYKLLSNTSFEECTCIGFNPDTNELNAVVVVKKKAGYSGGPCTDGSKEHVRFYLDYDGSGTWVDEGAANFDAHDLPFGESLCYDVKIKITPDKKRCCDEAAVLPKVRAILSWNQEPPAGQPNWIPTWGNRYEAFVQMDPRWGFLCWLKDIIKQPFGDNLEIIKNPPFGLNEATLKHVLPDLVSKETADFIPFSSLKTPLRELSIPELKRKYKTKVSDSRIAHKTISSLMAKPKYALYEKYSNVLKEAKIDISDLTEFIAKTKFNTSYEELKCVGLNRDLNTLTGNLLIKKKVGYLGDLCSAGSREYVAFYMDFGSGWEYQGTSSVNVHDIASIPNEGLWYGVELPVALSQHQKAWCNTGKAKVRAILSWNTLPTPNDPNYIATWGDWEECTVEVKSLPQGISPCTDPIPFIESLGGMPVSLIGPADGLANGSNGSGLTGDDSPFDGRILINGVILNAPDSYGPQANLTYKIMVKGPGESAFTPSPRPFYLYVTTYSGGIPSGPVFVKQTPDAQGYVDYLPDTIAPDMKSVDHAKLGEYYPAVSGLHELYIQVFDPNTASNYTSNSVKFMVDKTGPSVAIDITSGGGNCGVFGDSETMQGTFSISGDYCDIVELYITPGGSGWPSHGAKPVIVGMGDNRLDYGIDLPDNGYSGTWELDTSPMDPCGYNIWVHGEDRTIVNSVYRGHERWRSRGFCVMADEEEGV
ncbi:MAG: hypothetical protein GY847_09885 [Proteobacteria bacterium]|nr:hypothetical protein [Pseudomonadota bacterium]